MRLVRFGEVGKEKPGVVDRLGKRRDLSSEFEDWNAKCFADGVLGKLRTIDDMTKFPEVSTSERWGACIGRPGKIICIGLNYSDHALECDSAIPAEPVMFLKAPNTIVGPYDDVLIPRGGTKTDWEIELGLIIAKEARYLASVEDSMSHIAGYAIAHDVSERAFQLERGGQWTKGKSCDTFSPLGPWMSTVDEVSDVNNLSMKLWVNDTLRQNGTTANMIFNAGFLVHYLSQFTTLEPGDLILSGTPAGVGLGMKPPTYLKAGDIVRLEIEQLGHQKQTFIQA